MTSLFYLQATASGFSYIRLSDVILVFSFAFTSHFTHNHSGLELLSVKCEVLNL